MADQDIMQLMAQGGPASAGGEPMAPPPASDTPPPMPSPMATPEPKAGEREAAMINVSMALDLLERSLPQIGSSTPEGRKLMSALNSLTSIIGAKKQKTDELQAAEIMQLLQNLPQAAGALPGASAPGGAPPMPAPPAPMGAGAPPAMPPGMPPGGPTPPM
jgi:hypothetical protein